MGLSTKRRLYSTTFLAITVTVYIIALVLFFLPVPENETSEDDHKRFETRSDGDEHKNAAKKSRSSIRAFESSYVAAKPHKSKEIDEDYETRDLVALEKKRFTKYSFNELKSSKIGLDRKIPDNRQKQ